MPDEDGLPRYGPDRGTIGRIMVDVQDNGRTRGLTYEERNAARDDLTAREISVVIVGPMPYRSEMVALFTDLLREPPVQAGGVQIWRDVRQRLQALTFGRG